MQLLGENQLQSIAKKHGVKLNVLDCRILNKNGMALLLELRGRALSVRATIAAIRRTEGVRQASDASGSGDTVPLLVVLDSPAICRAAKDATTICLECPLNSEAQVASWRLVARKASDLRQVLANLERVGIRTRIEETIPLEPRTTLTAKQRQIVTKAVALGYFQFPRRISLSELAKSFGISSSALSETLRAAERRIMEDALAAADLEEWQSRNLV